MGSVGPKIEGTGRSARRRTRTEDFRSVNAGVHAESLTLRRLFIPRRFERRLSARSCWYEGDFASWLEEGRSLIREGCSSPRNRSTIRRGPGGIGKRKPLITGRR